MQSPYDASFLLCFHLSFGMSWPEVEHPYLDAPNSPIFQDITLSHDVLFFCNTCCLCALFHVKALPAIALASLGVLSYLRWPLWPLKSPGVLHFHCSQLPSSMLTPSCTYRVSPPLDQFFSGHRTTFIFVLLFEYLYDRCAWRRDGSRNYVSFWHCYESGHWRGGSVVKSICCSWRRPVALFSASTQCSQPPVTPVLGDPILSSVH